MKDLMSRIVAWSVVLLLGCTPPPAIAPPRSSAPPPIDFVSPAGVQTATFALG
jgi:hypothetical protein